MPSTCARWADVREAVTSENRVFMSSCGILRIMSAWADASRRPLSSAALRPNLNVCSILTPSYFSVRRSMRFFMRRMQPKNSTAQRMTAAAVMRKVEPDRPLSSLRSRQPMDTAPKSAPALDASFQIVVLSIVPFTDTKIANCVGFSNWALLSLAIFAHATPQSLRDSSITK